MSNTREKKKKAVFVNRKFVVEMTICCKLQFVGARHCHIYLCFLQLLKHVENKEWGVE
jgi:hypothetical protein